MPRSTNLSVATMGIDIGNNSFHVVGLDQRGAIVVRQRWTRSQIRARLANILLDRHGGLRRSPSPQPQADRWPPAPQKHQHHNDDQRHRLVDGLDQFMDRLGDEFGRVIADIRYCS